MSFSSGGYIGVTRHSFISHNKPKVSTLVLFNMLRRGGNIKKNIQTAMAAANGRLGKVAVSGYMASTIAWHITNGRLETTKVGRNTIVSLTDKGLKYAHTRGIF